MHGEDDIDEDHERLPRGVQRCPFGPSARDARMSGRATAAACTLISALALLACGCAASNPARPGPQSPSRWLTAQGGQLSPLNPEQQAVEIRTGLEELFGQDVFVGVRVTRSRLRGDPDFTQAAVIALSRNSHDLTTLLGRIYGNDLGSAVNRGPGPRSGLNMQVSGLHDAQNRSNA